MKFEDTLKNLKKQYIRTNAPSYLDDYGFLNLSQKISQQEKYIPVDLYLRKSLIYATFVILLMLIVSLASQSSKPGDVLFPVKIASGKIAAKITGNENLIIKNRVDEIIDLSEKNGQNLDNAIRNYEDTLNKTQEGQDFRKNQELQDILDEQKQKLEEARERNPQAAPKLDQAIEKTKSVQGEVKGQKENSSENSGENSNRNPNQHQNGNRGNSKNRSKF